MQVVPRILRPDLSGRFSFIYTQCEIEFKMKGRKKMKKELPKTYAPREFEERIYSAWCDAGYFAPDKMCIRDRELHLAVCLDSEDK